MMQKDSMDSGKIIHKQEQLQKEAAQEEVQQTVQQKTEPRELL